MNKDIKNLRDDIIEMENLLVEHIMSNIENLNLEINIVEKKMTSQGKFKKSIESCHGLQIKYEIHYLEESLSIDPITKKILYSNNKIGYNGIELSIDHYIKLRMAIIGRKKYFEMIDKKAKLEKILK